MFKLILLLSRVLYRRISKAILRYKTVQGSIERHDHKSRVEKCF